MTDKKTDRDQSTDSQAAVATVQERQPPASASAPSDKVDAEAAASAEQRPAVVASDDDVPMAVKPLPGIIGTIAAQLNSLPTGHLALAFVISLGAAILLPNLGNMGLFDCWETHYGEVAREMVMRNDYLYPYWKNAYFFSKPVLLLWMMAAGFNLAGATSRVGPLPEYTELGARMGVAMIALFALVAVYLAMSSIFNRRAGIFSAIVLITSPMFLMIGRQAITDMPYAGLATAGLAMFMIAMFSDSYQRSKWKKRVHISVLAFFALVTIPQYWLIIRSVVWLNGQAFGVRVAVFLGTVLLILAVAFWLYKRGQDSAMLLFYMLVALATLGKGLGGFMLPGLVIFMYLVVTWDWVLLKRIQIVTGGLLFTLIAFPWYVVLSLFTQRDEEHKTFAQRFWVHDHLNRLAAGVHGQRGTFDYYIRQLGFGTLSWAAIAPVALFDSLRQRIYKPRDNQEKARVFITVWAVILFVFFTAMQTKFHHYILPAVPPLAMITGLWLSKIWDSGKAPAGLLLAAIILFTMLVAADGVREPWSFIDMFTYHYISYKPEYYFPSKQFAYSAWIAGLTGIGLLFTISVVLWAHWETIKARVFGDTQHAGLAKLFFAPPRFVVELFVDFGRWLGSLVGGTPGRALAVSFSLTGFIMAVFISQVYMPQLAPHWSQRYLYNTYWSDKKGDEPNIAYLMNWRGETFYALNTDDQIKNASGLLTEMKKPGRKYIVVESKRYAGLESTLKAYKDKIEIIDRSNSKWYLVRIND